MIVHSEMGRIFTFRISPGGLENAKEFASSRAKKQGTASRLRGEKVSKHKSRMVIKCLYIIKL